MSLWSNVLRIQEHRYWYCTPKTSLFFKNKNKTDPQREVLRKLEKRNKKRACSPQGGEESKPTIERNLVPKLERAISLGMYDGNSFFTGPGSVLALCFRRWHCESQRGVSFVLLCCVLHNDGAPFSQHRGWPPVMRSNRVGDYPMPRHTSGHLN